MVGQSGRRPDLSVERSLISKGHRLVGGVDEVGRGAWAGPLTVCIAVVDDACTQVPGKLRDSKQLLERLRESIFPAVSNWCATWSIGHATNDECDELGMTAALAIAANRAYKGLPEELRPSALILDGTVNFMDGISQSTNGLSQSITVETLPHADATCASVAAASVLAKVTRDRIMLTLSSLYPGYDLAGCKGYHSRAHVDGLTAYGLTGIHRKSWSYASGYTISGR